MSSASDAKAVVDDYFYRKHRQVILGYLKDNIYSVELWFAVGYFAYGAGQYSDHSFATTEQWEKLLTDTGRDGRYIECSFSTS